MFGNIFAQDTRYREIAIRKVAGQTEILVGANWVRRYFPLLLIGGVSKRGGATTVLHSYVGLICGC